MYAGIEIGGSKLQIVVGDDQAHILARHRYQVDPAQGAGGIRQQIENAFATELSPTSFAAVGVGFGGPVDRARGRIEASHQIEGWGGFPLSEWLHSITGLPVVLDNDANTAALGEARSGAGRGCNPVFYVTLGSGVGGGLVLDGAIYHGAPPGEAEIGHLRLDQSGRTVESACSGWAVDRKIREAVKHEAAGVLAREVQPLAGGEARALPPALALGDPVAQRIVDETAGDLGFALSHVIHLFHPEVIVLGGGLSLIGESWRSAVEKALAPLVMRVFARTYRVALAQLLEDSVPVGALHLARLAVSVTPHSSAEKTG